MSDFLLEENQRKINEGKEPDIGQFKRLMIPLIKNREAPMPIWAHKPVPLHRPDGLVHYLRSRYWSKGQTGDTSVIPDGIRLGTYIN